MVGFSYQKLLLLVVGIVFVTGCPSGVEPPDLTNTVSATEEEQVTLGLVSPSDDSASCEDSEAEKEFQIICDASASMRYPVLLSPFSIDMHEVTNRQYRQCVSDGVCKEIPIDSDDSSSRCDDYFFYEYYENSVYGNHPVVCVTWQMAKDYCTWAGKELPTEARWEFSAKGHKNDSHKFPWGNDVLPDCTEADTEQDAITLGCGADEGRFPASIDAGANDVTSAGVRHMGGNVEEWVEDYFNSSQYCQDHTQSTCTTGENCIKDPCGSSTPFNCLARSNIDYDENPKGPVEGTERVVRGGSFKQPRCFSTLFFRNRADPQTREVHRGFRCAKSNN